MTEEIFSERLKTVLISPEEPIAEAVRRLDEAGTGVLLVCDADRRLRGVLTDGDIRRAMLRNISFQEPCRTIATAEPVVGRPETTPAEALEILNRADLNQLPIVDAQDSRIVGLLLRRDLVSSEQLGLSAVIMAGGFGTRLQPLTKDTPKPMLPVGDRPLLERTIGRLREAGIKHVNVTTHYLAERITSYFGDGEAFGVEINYVSEDRPMGTAGGLRLMDAHEEPLLVINGDILTAMDFRDLLAYHRRHRAELTVCVRKYDFQVPYGVLECDGPRVVGIREKPVVSFLVNAGIYLLEPSAQRFIPVDRPFDMTDLIARLIKEGRPMVSYPVVEYWLDVGRQADYKQANEDVEKARL